MFDKRGLYREVEKAKKQEGSMRKFLVAMFLLAASSANAQQVAPASKFIRENAPVIAVTHVQLIDGSGAPAQADQTIVMDHGTIAAVGPTAGTTVPAGAKVIDGKGKTLRSEERRVGKECR